MRGIGKLLVKTQIDFLTCYFRRQHAQGQIRDLILWIHVRPFGQVVSQILHKVRTPITVKSGNHEGLIKRVEFMQFRSQFQEFIALNLIDLIDQ